MSLANRGLHPYPESNGVRKRGRPPKPKAEPKEFPVEKDEALEESIPKPGPIDSDPRLLQPVSSLKLPLREVNLLNEDGIHTVGQLLEADRVRLLAIANFGQKCLESVYKALEAFGFGSTRTLQKITPEWSRLLALARAQGKWFREQEWLMDDSPTTLPRLELRMMISTPLDQTELIGEYFQKIKEILDGKQFRLGMKVLSPREMEIKLQEGAKYRTHEWVLIHPYEHLVKWMAKFEEYRDALKDFEARFAHWRMTEMAHFEKPKKTKTAEE